MLHGSSVAAEATAAAWPQTYGFVLLELLGVEQRLARPVLPFISTLTELEKLVLGEQNNCPYNDCRFQLLAPVFWLPTSNLEMISEWLGKSLGVKYIFYPMYS